MGTEQPHRNRAVFLDRDGVINANILNPTTGQMESPLTPEDFTLLPGVSKALRALQDAGFLLILVSNQPNYAKGKASLATLQAIHANLLALLAQERIELAASFYCLHHPKGIVPEYTGTCPCRKPSPYFLHKAEREFSLDLAASWMIGDRASDIACGRAAGVRTILVGESQKEERRANQDHQDSSLPAAARRICNSVIEVATQLHVRHRES